MRSIRTTAIALGALIGLLGLTVPAAAQYDGSASETFVLGGAHADLAAGTPIAEASIDEAAGVATCGLEGAGPGPGLPGGVPTPEPVSIGGACFVLPGNAQEQVSVHADRLMPDVYTPIGLAAGYDHDGDGCIGCTPEDELWQGRGELVVPVDAEVGSIMVFAYAADADPGGYPATATVTLGEITVSPADDAPPCGEQVTLPDHGCEAVPEDQLTPHLCVPACQLLLDTPG